MESKQCRNCKEVKSVLEFHRRSTNKDYLQDKCKSCAALYAREYAIREKNKIKVTSKKYYDKNKHRISVQHKIRYRKNISASRQLSRQRKWNRLGLKLTLEDYEKIFSAQHGKCAICFRKYVDRPLSVDHCHKTGVVRGLLCNWCNSILLNVVENNFELVKAAKEYLNREKL